MKTDVFIAGAGLSGLSLALALQERDVPCLLAEARGRTGGRILTMANELDGIGKTVADIGPSWIWPGQQRVQALLRRFAIDTFEQYSNGLLVYEDELGQVKRDLDFSTMAGSLRVSGGLARLTAAITERLSTDSLLRKYRVTCIEYLDPGYRVSLEHDGGGLQVQAARVVLAIPPRVLLRDIRFEPPLPPGASEALAAIPTWMAGHAKVFAIYARPFWRAQGLSGDAISRRGPLMEIHDASPEDAAYGALFGFVGTPAGAELREPQRLEQAARDQLGTLFGDAAANPLEMHIKDWFADAETATPADAQTTSHPTYGTPASLADLGTRGLLFASTEMAPAFGGFIEGALEAAEAALLQLQAPAGLLR